MKVIVPVLAIAAACNLGIAAIEQWALDASFDETCSIDDAHICTDSLAYLELRGSDDANPFSVPLRGEHHEKTLYRR